jgi:hypothetical protein
MVPRTEAGALTGMSGEVAFIYGLDVIEYRKLHDFIGLPKFDTFEI